MSTSESRRAPKLVRVDPETHAELARLAKKAGPGSQPRLIRRLVVEHGEDVAREMAAEAGAEGA